MEWSDGLFLSDEEIKVLAIFLAYGVGIGVLVGLFVGNIQLCFALGGVISILVSLIKTFIERVKKSNKIHI
ncbi:hypothetical protein [Clostridium sp.]|uniref:hypothetical protein n=1 Tax=Clostridium sp. TaxID=1506 RepID=UPI001EC01A3C|nr:hypothetical protein [Clostridium sp.]MBS5884326.1 hypothetical protein [Clostridium sp.]MDU7242065.1 hypothetical protein [Clostridium sp.]